MASKLQRVEDDRLSSLPDGILLLILSFMDMKHAVLTGILSSRWRGLWTFVPSLEFESTFARGYKGKYKPDESSFVRFVDKSLESHAAVKIQKFRLCFMYRKEHDSYVDRWIRFAVRKGVQELDIDLIGYRNLSLYMLPCWIFECKTLVSLKMSDCTLNFLKSPSFRMLTKLSLSKMFFNNEMLQVWLAGCPLLEDLVLMNCKFSFGAGAAAVLIRIRSSLNSKLKYLTLEGCQARGIEVDAPSLQALKLSSRILDLCSLNDMFSLSEAHLNVDYICSVASKLDLSSLKLSIQNLCHAKVLDLSSSCIEAMHTPTFKDLHSFTFKTKRLILQTRLHKIELPGIANLLWSSPDLETLVINLVPHECLMVYGSNDEESCARKIDFDENEYWESLTVSFPCLVHRLKSVKITNFIRQRKNSLGDFTNEINLVRFLLRNAMVLEKITIHVSDKPRSVRIGEWEKSKMKVTQKLIAIPRASPFVDVIFSYE